MFKPDKYQEMALKTWYNPDDPNYRNPRHPLIKLAGEAGELLDLYGKHEYKPGFDWMDCARCGVSSQRLEQLKIWTGGDVEQCCHDGPVPKVLDELGDWWYYLRIVCFIYGQPTAWMKDTSYRGWDTDKLLAVMASNSVVMLEDWLDYKRIDGSRLKVLYGCLVPLLEKLEYPVDLLTDLNYRKLNTDDTAHGWRK